MDKEQSIFSYKSPEVATGFLLYKTHAIWQREIKRNLKEIGITHTQFVILASTHWLFKQNADCTQIDIAKHAQMDVMMTSNVIRTLEKKNILTRTNHKTDTRAKVVNLTANGLEILKIAVKKVEKFDRNFFKNLKNSNNFNAELNRLLK